MSSRASAGSASTAIALYGAAALAGAFSILLDTFVYSYYRTYTWGSILVAAVLSVVSSVVLGGVCRSCWATLLPGPAFFPVSRSPRER